MDSSNYRPVIYNLLQDSPVTRPSVVQDVHELLMVGEEGIALDTLCSWIYEDELPITKSYHDRLSEIADVMGVREIVEKLRELIQD